MPRLAVTLLLLTTWAASATAIEFHLQDAEAPDAPSDLSVDQASPEQGVPVADDVSLGDCCCDCCCPSWTANIGYVYLWRERTGNAPILADADTGGGPAGTGTPVVLASQFDVNGESGIDVSLAWDNGCGLGYQLRYFGVTEFGDSQTVNFGFDVTEATNPQTSGAPGAQPIGLQLESRLQSVELVRRKCAGTLNITYGYRYVDLDETLRINFANGGDTFDVENGLHGFQLGIDGLLWDNGCGLQVAGIANAGVYYNDTDVEVQSTFGPVSGQQSEGETAFVGEVVLAAQYDISCCLSLRAGYQLLYLDGILLGSDQVSRTGNLNTNAAPGGGFLPPTFSRSSDSVLYHGVHVGVEYRR